MLSIVKYNLLPKLVSHDFSDSCDSDGESRCWDFTLKCNVCGGSCVDGDDIDCVEMECECHEHVCYDCYPDVAAEFGYIIEKIDLLCKRKKLRAKDSAPEYYNTLRVPNSTCRLRSSHVMIKI